MTVFARTLGPYDGPLVPRSRRFLVIWSSSRRQIFASRILTAFYALSFAPLLLLLLWTYGYYQLPYFQGWMEPGARVFFVFLQIQGILAFLMTAFVGPALIVPDLTDNALSLYLARPITRAGYILGKATGLAIVLSAMTWVPAAGVWALKLAYDGQALSGADLRVLFGIVAGSLLWIALITMLSLAISAWIRWRLIAAALLFAFFFISRAMGALLNVQFGTRWGDVVSPYSQMTTVWEGLFFGTASGIPQPLAWLLLTALAGLGVLLLHRKLRAYEVVR